MKMFHIVIGAMELMFDRLHSLHSCATAESPMADEASVYMCISTSSMSIENASCAVCVPLVYQVSCGIVNMQLVHCMCRLCIGCHSSLALLFAWAAYNRMHQFLAAVSWLTQLAHCAGYTLGKHHFLPHVVAHSCCCVYRLSITALEGQFQLIRWCSLMARHCRTPS